MGIRASRWRQEHMSMREPTRRRKKDNRQKRKVGRTGTSRDQYNARTGVLVRARRRWKMRKLANTHQTPYVSDLLKQIDKTDKRRRR